MMIFDLTTLNVMSAYISDHNGLGIHSVIWSRTDTMRRCAMPPPLSAFSQSYFLILTLTVNRKPYNPKNPWKTSLIITLPLFLVEHSLGSSTEQQHSSQKIKKQKTGVLEGFRLFLTYDYIKGIFALSCLFMIEVTIFDYAMKVGWWYMCCLACSLSVLCVLLPV